MLKLFSCSKLTTPETLPECLHHQPHVFFFLKALEMLRKKTWMWLVLLFRVSTFSKHWKVGQFGRLSKVYRFVRRAHSSSFEITTFLQDQSQSLHLCECLWVPGVTVSPQSSRGCVPAKGQDLGCIQGGELGWCGANTGDLGPAGHSSLVRYPAANANFDGPNMQDDVGIASHTACTRDADGLEQWFLGLEGWTLSWSHHLSPKTWTS